MCKLKTIFYFCYSNWSECSIQACSSVSSGKLTRWKITINNILIWYTKLYTYLTGWFVCTESYIVDNSEVLLHVKQMKYKLYIIQVEYVNKFFHAIQFAWKSLKIVAHAYTWDYNDFRLSECVFYNNNIELWQNIGLLCIKVFFFL